MAVRVISTTILGLDPKTQTKRNGRMKGGSVYILASKRNGTLYTGVTSDLTGRVWEHRTGAMTGFTKRYGVKMLAWFAEYADIRDALEEERRIKRWRRAWKIALIEELNPQWRDLFEEIAHR